MVVHVVVGDGGHRVLGEGCADLDLVNAFLSNSQDLWMKIV